MVAIAGAQDVVPLYPGVPPGSKQENYPEKQYLLQSVERRDYRERNPAHYNHIQAIAETQQWHGDGHRPGRRAHGHFRRCRAALKSRIFCRKDTLLH